MLQKIVSGGQTGVDRAALDAALALGIPCEGWCPKGRIAEDGVIAPRYPLKETPSEEYAQRTEWNVRDSDGTLIVALVSESTTKKIRLGGGTAYTLEIARRLGKPHFVVDPRDAPELSVFRTWIDRNRIQVLNVAGPRESRCPGIYFKTHPFLTALLGQTFSMTSVPDS
jgi:hypothetical protein